MKALPDPCAITIAKAMSAHATHTAAAGARAMTDSKVWARISQWVNTSAPTIAAADSRLNVARIGRAAAFCPAMPRSTLHALANVLARKNTQVTFTRV